MKRRILSVAMFLSLPLLFSFACINPGESEVVDATERVPDQVVSDYRITQMNEDELDWELHSKRASIYNDENMAYIEQVKLYFFQDEEVSSTLTSDRGEVDTQTNDMVAIGHVVVRTADGAILLTDRLRWHNEEEKIRSEDEVWFKRGRTLIHGYGFESDPELKSFRTTRASGDVTPEDLRIFSEMDEEMDESADEDRLEDVKKETDGESPEKDSAEKQ